MNFGQKSSRSRNRRVSNVRQRRQQHLLDVKVRSAERRSIAFEGPWAYSAEYFWSLRCAAPLMRRARRRKTPDV